MTKLAAIQTPNDLQRWQSGQPSMMRLAAFLNRVSPRGKGAIPRFIGRRFGGRWKTTITTDSGCKLAVDPANLDLFVTIENEGAWEPWIRRVCTIAMQNGGVMFDVGANAGAISNETALACPGITIKAFEPQVELARLVAVSAQLNGLHEIEVFSVAVGDHEGTVQLHKPAHALHASLMTSGQAGEAVVDVPLISLDWAVHSGQLPAPTFIKVDVEGGELGVLNGAQQILTKYQPVVIFEANESSDRFGYGREDLFARFRQCGDYEFFWIAPGDVLASPKRRATEFESHYQRV
ncbi:FkbM family methyltransferase [Stieleria sp. ICT_E10.1]|uniref:FkbM family methyltransferase n=1 Tax=Stieleria sedimenti TaxID=2976331 RepID=UPI00218041BE|nr:FkbM family methyltransferase [Stieleria sedimenti]MCS7469437.1 FkbM family methyltransferase [Stieleria sedimenti]